MLRKKEKGPCVDCGELNIKVLQFDHINKEDKSKGVTRCSTKESIDIEIAKCEMRCVICHIRKTKEQLNWKQKYNAMQDYIDKKKTEIGSCQLCGWYDKTLIEALHFDHIDRSNKTASIAKMGIKKYSRKEIDNEIAKCRLICANCHRLHTIEQLDYIDNTNMSKNEARKLKEKERYEKTLEYLHKKVKELQEQMLENMKIREHPFMDMFENGKLKSEYVDDLE